MSGFGGNPSAFSKVYESALQTIPGVGSLVIAHDLAVMPKGVTAFLVCQTAEHNYSVGDVLVVNPSMNAAPDGSDARGVSITFTSAAVYVRYSSSATAFAVLDKVGSVSSRLLTNANWQMKVEAWA